MILDCHTCPARPRACHECFVPMLLDAPVGLPLDDDEQRALAAFVDAGLVSGFEAMSVRAHAESWPTSRVG